MRARALGNGSSTMQSTALCLLLRYLRRPKRATRCFFLWICLPRMEQLRRLTLPRPAPRAVQDASQHGWLKSVPLLRLVDV